MSVQRGKDDGPPRLEDLAGRLLGTVLDLGWAAWKTALEVADFSVRAVRAAAGVLLDSGLPRAGDGRGARPGGADRLRAGNGSPGGATTPSPTDRSAPGAPPGVPAPGGGESRDPFLPPLPTGGDRDRLVAVERDPGTLYAWWDVSAESRARARAEIARDAPDLLDEPSLVLRVALAGAPPREIALPAFATGGYVERPGDEVGMEITLGLSRRGRFARLAGPFAVPGRSPRSRSEGHVWRRVGDSAASGPDGVVPAPSTAPSPEESDRLAALAAGWPEPGSPPWSGIRRRGPIRGPGGSAGSSS